MNEESKIVSGNIEPNNYIIANVADAHWVNEIEQSVIVGLEDRLDNIEKKLSELDERLEDLNNMMEVMGTMVIHELNILKNPKSTWEANSKGGV